MRIVVPFSAGSITDGLARILAEKLADMWKQQVIVENRPGLPGTTSVAKAAPDGYTLMLTSNGHTIAGAITKSLQFDPVKDFAGVTRVASVPLVAIVPPDLPAKTLKEFDRAGEGEARARSISPRPASPAPPICRPRSSSSKPKINIVHVPFRGAPEAVTAVVRGDVQMYLRRSPSSQELSAEAGKVRAIAINSASAHSQLPDVPTIAEAAVPDYMYESWFGVLAPAGTPQADPRQGQPGHRGKVLQMRRRERQAAEAGLDPGLPTRPSSSTPSSRTTPSSYDRGVQGRSPQ